MSDAFIVEFTLRDEDVYSYESVICFASGKEAWDFYDTLPAYAEKHYPPKCIGAICHYNKENLRLS